VATTSIYYLVAAVPEDIQALVALVQTVQTVIIS
jgi:hypothetical protein